MNWSLCKAWYVNWLYLTCLYVKVSVESVAFPPVIRLLTLFVVDVLLNVLNFKMMTKGNKRDNATYLLQCMFVFLAGFMCSRF